MIEQSEQSDTAIGLPSVGRWVVTVIPQGWMFMADFGIRQTAAHAGAVTANVCLGQDATESAEAFVPYLERQRAMIAGHLKEAKLAGPQPAQFAGADEAFLLAARHSVEGVGNLLHAQTYIREGKWVGIITLTVMETQLKEVRPAYDAFVKGLRIGPKAVRGEARESGAAELQAEGA